MQSNHLGEWIEKRTHEELQNQVARQYLALLSELKNTMFSAIRIALKKAESEATQEKLLVVAEQLLQQIPNIINVETAKKILADAENISKSSPELQALFDTLNFHIKQFENATRAVTATSEFDLDIALEKIPNYEMQISRAESQVRLEIDERVYDELKKLHDAIPIARKAAAFDKAKKKIQGSEFALLQRASFASMKISSNSEMKHSVPNEEEFIIQFAYYQAAREAKEETPDIVQLGINYLPKEIQLSLANQFQESFTSGQDQQNYLKSPEVVALEKQIKTAKQNCAQSQADLAAEINSAKTKEHKAETKPTSNISAGSAASTGMFASRKPLSTSAESKITPATWLMTNIKKMPAMYSNLKGEKNNKVDKLVSDCDLIFKQRKYAEDIFNDLIKKLITICKNKANSTKLNKKLDDRYFPRLIAALLQQASKKYPEMKINLGDVAKVTVPNNGYDYSSTPAPTQERKLSR